MTTSTIFYLLAKSIELQFIWTPLQCSHLIRHNQSHLFSSERIHLFNAFQFRIGFEMKRSVCINLYFYAQIKHRMQALILIALHRNGHFASKCSCEYFISLDRQCSFSAMVDGFQQMLFYPISWAIWTSLQLLALQLQSVQLCRRHLATNSNTYAARYKGILLICENTCYTFTLILCFMIKRQQ